MGHIDCLLDIVGPDIAEQHLPGIEEEATGFIAEVGGDWHNAAVNQCYRTDSELRESLHFSDFISQKMQKRMLPADGVKGEVE